MATSNVSLDNGFDHLFTTAIDNELSDVTSIVNWLKVNKPYSPFDLEGLKDMINESQSCSGELIDDGYRVQQLLGVVTITGRTSALQISDRWIDYLVALVDGLIDELSEAEESVLTA